MAKKKKSKSFHTAAKKKKKMVSRSSRTSRKKKFSSSHGSGRDACIKSFKTVGKVASSGIGNIAAAAASPLIGGSFYAVSGLSNFAGYLGEIAGEAIGGSYC
jgi:isoaspartyl peptidase/L-asparaginase-like protein (Ntn-hydrolase superfamily)